MLTCKNCGHTFNLNFCPNCGQKGSVRRIDFKTITKDIPFAILDTDRGFVFNFIELYRRPGYAIKDYLDGKRKNFYHPLSYMLFVVATMLVAMNFLNIHYYDPVQDFWMSADQVIFWKEYEKAQQVWIHYYIIFIPFYLPWMSLIFYLWLKILKCQYNYWECIVISFFVSAQMTIPQIFVLIAVYIFDSTAFARYSDMFINNTFLFTLYFFQFYQLGGERLKKMQRVLLAFLGALILLAFAYLAIFAFLNLSTLFGL